MGFWIDHVRANHGSLHFCFADTTDFRGGTLVQRNPEHQLVNFWSDGLHYSRTDADVRADGQRGNLLIVAQHGVLDVEQDGDRIRLQPGWGMMVTKSRPFQLRHDSWARGWTFDAGDKDPSGAIEQRPAVVDLQHGLGSVVRAMISTVSTQHRTLDCYDFSRSCTTISDLLSACATDRGGTPTTLDAVEQAVREFVAHHACDPDLTPRIVARSLGWSVRQVQLALHRAGTTTSDLIRSTRVIRAADLLRQSPPNTTISSIAFASGFRSMTTFEGVFKKQFGLTPREARIVHSQSADYPWPSVPGLASDR